MSATPGARRFDERTWSVATRSLPFVIQPILAGALIIAWLLGNSVLPWGAPAATNTVRLLMAVGLSAAIALLVAGMLFRRDSSIMHGIGLSTIASAAIVGIAGGGFALSIPF